MGNQEERPLDEDAPLGEQSARLATVTAEPPEEARKPRARKLRTKAAKGIAEVRAPPAEGPTPEKVHKALGKARKAVAKALKALGKAERALNKAQRALERSTAVPRKRSFAPVRVSVRSSQDEGKARDQDD